MFDTDGFNYDGDKDDSDTDNDNVEDNNENDRDNDENGDNNDDKTTGDTSNVETGVGGKAKKISETKEMLEEENSEFSEISKGIPFEESQLIAFPRNSTQNAESLVSFGTPTSSINDSRKEVLSSVEADRKQPEFDKVVSITQLCYFFYFIL